MKHARARGHVKLGPCELLGNYLPMKYMGLLVNFLSKRAFFENRFIKTQSIVLQAEYAQIQEFCFVGMGLGPQDAYFIFNIFFCAFKMVESWRQIAVTCTRVIP